MLEFLRRSWLVVALVFLVGAGLTALAISKHKAYYKATSKIVCKANQGSDSRLMALPELASLAPFLSGGGRDPSTYFEDLVKDPEFLYRILEDTFQTSTGALQYHELEEVPLPDSVLRNPLLKMMKYGSIASGRKAIQLLRAKGTIIQIISRSGNPDGALEVNKRVISSLNQYLVTNMKSQAKQNRMFIETRVREVESELGESERRLVSFREKNRDISSPRLSVELANLARAVALNQEIYTQLRKQLELSKIEESREMPLIEIISAPQPPMDASGPSRSDFAKIGLFLAVMASLLIGVLFDWLFASTGTAGPALRSATKSNQGVKMKSENTAIVVEE